MEGRTLVPGTVVAGRYRVIREIGRGAMGVVFVVEHVNTGGLLALKVMLDGFFMEEDRAARFRREARASARIASENVVRVTDADTAPELGGAPFLVMELLEGVDLDQLLRSREKLTAHETVNILVQVGRALDKAHASGVVHRDLKPENIFLHKKEDGSMIVKVVDFGISKILRPDLGASAIGATSTNSIMGTPLYMSPEQAMAQNDAIGPATDVWAIGLVAYQMLSGRVYWNAASVAEIIVQILAEDREAPSARVPDFSPAFDAWFLKSCAMKPQDRFASAAEQAVELALALTGERISLTASAPAMPHPLLKSTIPRASHHVASTLPLGATPNSLQTPLQNPGAGPNSMNASPRANANANVASAVPNPAGMGSSPSGGPSRFTSSPSAPPPRLGASTDVPVSGDEWKPPKSRGTVLIVLAMFVAFAFVGGGVALGVAKSSHGAAPSASATNEAPTVATIASSSTTASSTTTNASNNAATSATSAAISSAISSATSPPSSNTSASTNTSTASTTVTTASRPPIGTPKSSASAKPTASAPPSVTKPQKPADLFDTQH